MNRKLIGAFKMSLNKMSLNKMFAANLHKVSLDLQLFIVCFVLINSISTAQTAQSIVEAARSQIGVTVSYDPAYTSMDYPMGDVPRNRGVCTDVIIRALRESIGMDLQKLIHEDMKENFDSYPKKWGLRRPDRNIDHRRVPNLRTYFRRSGWKLIISDAVIARVSDTVFSELNQGSAVEGDYLPGDIVTCTVPPSLDHIMIISDRSNLNGVPLVIHNIGGGTREEDRLLDFPITGHFRVPPL